MKNTNIIIIIGAKRSGKDTLAKYIADKYEYKIVKISEKLKKCLKILFDFSNEQLENDEKDIIDERWGLSPRKIMQFFGTEILQNKIQEILPQCNKNFLINNFKNTIDKNKKYIISDLRFLHEYNALLEYNPYVILIQRDNIKYYDNHISELEYTKIPYNIKILNNGSFTDLYDKFEIEKKNNIYN